MPRTESQFIFGQFWFWDGSQTLLHEIDEIHANVLLLQSTALLCETKP
jgi:hypothetical protein